MPPTWTETIDNLFSSTWALRKTEAIDQAFLKTPVIFWLREAGRVDHINGFKRIEIPLNYGSNETVRWITRGTPVPIQDSEIITIAYEDWRYCGVSIMRWFEVDQKNRGKAQAINLVTTQIDTAERSLWEELERVVFADGTGQNEPNGLKNLISTSGAADTSTVHGISRSTYSWFRNQSKVASGAAEVYLVSDMRTCLNDVTKYSKSELKDVFMVTDQASFELYEDVCLEMKILMNTKLADAGFDSIVFKGRPMIWSPSAPSGEMRFINPNYIKLVTDEGFFMEMTDWKSIPDQPFDRVAQIVCTLNMVVSRPICQKVLYNIA
jgi:hypothetical protein